MDKTKSIQFDQAVRRNLSRSFRLTVVVLTALGVISCVNGFMLLIFGQGFTFGILDHTMGGIFYLLLWGACLYAASVFTKNGYKRGYELFLKQVDALGKREEVLERIQAMPLCELPAARGAILRFDSWGLAYAYRETFAVLPCDKLLKARVVAKVLNDASGQKPLETDIIIEYTGDEELRIPVKDRDEAHAIIKRLQKAFPRLQY